MDQNSLHPTSYPDRYRASRAEFLLRLYQIAANGSVDAFFQAHSILDLYDCLVRHTLARPERQGWRFEIDSHAFIRVQGRYEFIVYPDLNQESGTKYHLVKWIDDREETLWNQSGEEVLGLLESGHET
jgi:hypothetical protein